MSSEENKALLRRYITEVWVQKDPAAADGFLAPDYLELLQQLGAEVSAGR